MFPSNQNRGSFLENPETCGPTNCSILLALSKNLNESVFVSGFSGDDSWRGWFETLIKEIYITMDSVNKSVIRIPAAITIGQEIKEFADVIHVETWLNLIETWNIDSSTEGKEKIKVYRNCEPWSQNQLVINE